MSKYQLNKHKQGKLLFDTHDHWTQDALALEQEAISALRPIIKTYIKKGFSTVGMIEIISQAASFEITMRRQEFARVSSDDIFDDLYQHLKDEEFQTVQLEREQYDD